MSSCRIARLVAMSAVLLLPATAARAQTVSSIAGVVKDTSGAVMPGVTVEASSPALIEKVRNAVTDGEGLFKIVDLRPGTYAVTFTLPGFSVVKRDGIDLPSRKMTGVMYEYACHEGNYAMTHALLGSRVKEAEEAAKKKD